MPVMPTVPASGFRLSRTEGRFLGGFCAGTFGCIFLTIAVPMIIVVLALMHLGSGSVSLGTSHTCAPQPCMAGAAGVTITDIHPTLPEGESTIHVTVTLGYPAAATPTTVSSDEFRITDSSGRSIPALVNGTSCIAWQSSRAGAQPDLCFEVPADAAASPVTYALNWSGSTDTVDLGTLAALSAG